MPAPEERKTTPEQAAAIGYNQRAHLELALSDSADDEAAEWADYVEPNHDDDDENSQEYWD